MVIGAAELFTQVINSFYLRPTVRVLFHRDDPVIALFIFLVPLLTFDDTDGTASENATRSAESASRLDVIPVIATSHRVSAYSHYAARDR